MITIGTPLMWMPSGRLALAALALDFFALCRQGAQGFPLSQQHHTALGERP